MGSQVRVPIASESVYRTNYSLRASAIRFGVSTASGFAPTEPPTMVWPLHRLSLGSLCCRHTATSTSSAMPYVKLSLELPHYIESGVTGASPQCIKDEDRSIDHAATVTSYRARKRHLRSQDAT